MADCFLCKNFDCDWIEDCPIDEEREVVYCDKRHFWEEELTVDELENMDCDDWESDGIIPGR